VNSESVCVVQFSCNVYFKLSWEEEHLKVVGRFPSSWIVLVRKHITEFANVETSFITTNLVR